ncbi:MAG: hypothetical protein GPJ54_12595 [Candidatus Heimdallarchaeota archaeon]|nr:hypothetical protein [Candidatus Heimdallarchaeota archaeon]
MSSGSTRFNKVQIIMFTSTFCSKCLYNRKLWKEVTKGVPDLLEINIADESNKVYLEQFEPRVSPTIFVIDNLEVIYSVTGVLNSKIVHSILEMYRHLSQK